MQLKAQGQLVEAQTFARRAVDLFAALFKRAITSDLRMFATGEALAHLNCLIGRGRARRRTTPDGVWLYEVA